MANINKIRISGTSYDIQDLNAIKVVDITQAAYDSLPSSAKTANILYNITDAEAADLSQYWTSAQTQSAITEATSGCTVNETVIYVSWGDNYRDAKSEQESVRLRNAILNYLGDKTTATSVNVQVQTYNINTQNWYYPYITLDYVNGTYTKLQDDNDTIAVEYDSTIEDFKLSVPSTQPSIYIRGIYFYGGEVLVPTATIESGSTSDVIEGSIANLIGDLYSKDLKSVKNTTLMTNSPKELSFAFFRKDGTSESTLLKLDDLIVDTRGSQTLKTDINIPLGTSGWTNVDISQSNCSTDYLGEPLPFLSFRITCDSKSMDYLALYLKAGYINYYTNFYIRWDYNENKFKVTNSMFSGTTLNWDSANQILTVELPATIEEGGETHDTVLYKLYSDYCRFGTDITKLEYYGEITTPIKQYVQTLRTDVNTISGEVQSKVSTSAITTAVTSSSTDSEVPSAKCLYDTIGNIETLLSQI